MCILYNQTRRASFKRLSSGQRSCTARHSRSRRILIKDRDRGARLSHGHWQLGDRMSNSRQPRSFPTHPRPKRYPTLTHTYVRNLLQANRLRIDIGEGVQSYTKAGQFLQIKIGDSKPAFMAIASPPEEDTTSIELIINCSGGTAEQLCSMTEGAF